MEETREEKQKFLREGVLDQGYDASDFVDYLVSVRQDGENIDIWSLEELKQQVSRFKELASKKFEVVEEEHQHEKEDAGHSLQNLTQTLFQREGKLKPVTYQKYSTSERELKRKVKCIQFRPYVNKDISAFTFTVEKPEVKVIGGILGFGGINQIWYTVRSSLIEGDIKREDEDFEWLRKTLHRFYPANFVRFKVMQIPPLRRTKSFLPEDTKSLDKRTLMIRAFLDALLKQPLMFNTRLLLNFFSIADYSKFQRFKQEIGTIGFMKVLSNLQTESGTAQLEISTDNQRAMKAASQYAHQAGDKYRSLKLQLRTLMRHLDDATSSLYRLANGFADLQKLQSELSNSAPELQNVQLTEMFIDINNFLIQWGRGFQQKRKAVERNIGIFFKYSKQENDAIKDLLRRREEAEEEYIKFKIALEKRKEKAYPDTTKWEIPKNVLSKLPQLARMPKDELMSYLLPKQTDKMARMREWVGYLNKMAETELVRILPLITDRFRERWKALGTDLVQATKAELGVVGKLEALQ